MKDFDEPRRLFENQDAPAELRAWLGRAHEDVPSAPAVDELLRAVEHRTVSASSAPGQGTHGAWATRAARHSTKLVAVAAVVGVGAGIWYVGSAGHRTPGHPAPAAVPSESPLPRLPRETSPGAPAPALSPSSTRPARAAASESAAAMQPRATSPAHSTHASGHELREETDTAVSTTTVSGPDEFPAAVTNTGEFRLLRAARQELAEHPARALALTDEHARRFARGMLAQEREAIAVEALLQLGQEGQARARARSFFAEYPRSPHRSRIQRALDRSSGAAIQP